MRCATILLKILNKDDPKEIGRQFLTEVGLDFLGIITILAVLKLSEKELSPARTSLNAFVNKLM